MDWGPYLNQQDARSCITAFADDVLKQNVGVIWSSDDDAIWLRPPIYDRDGLGLTLLARFDGVVAPPSPAPPSLTDKIDRFLGGALTQLGRLDAQNADVASEVGRAEDKFIYQHALKPINDFISRYEYVKDGITVMMDVAGVVAGTAAAVALVTVGGSFIVTVGLAAGALAGLASLALLVEDGRHCWFTLRDDEVGKIALESTSKYRWIEAVGPLLAIPDLALSGRAALREAGELAEKADRIAASRAAAALQSQRAARNLRETVNDGDQSAAILANAANTAASRAADYQKMVRQAKAANHRLLMAREGVIAYGGTLWGTGLYTYDPPELTRRASRQIFNPPPTSGGLKGPSAQLTLPASFGLTPPLSEVPTQNGLPRTSLQPETNPWRLLEPTNGKCSRIPQSGLQLTSVVASRPTVKSRR